MKALLPFIPAILYIIAACYILPKLTKWAARPKLIELMRFPGNEEAKHNYQRRAEAGGHLARNVRNVP